MNIRLPATPTAADVPSRPTHVEVDEDIERLEDHHEQHEAHGLQEVPADGAGGEVLHGHVIGWQVRNLYDPTGAKTPVARARVGGVGRVEDKRECRVV